MTFAFVLFLFLLYLEKNRTKPGIIYATTITLYGAYRFVLNWFRWDQDAFVFGLPPGTVWSICAVAIGAIWLLAIYAKHKKLIQT